MELEFERIRRIVSCDLGGIVTLEMGFEVSNPVPDHVSVCACSHACKDLQIRR